MLEGCSLGNADIEGFEEGISLGASDGDEEGTSEGRGLSEGD